MKSFLCIAINRRFIDTTHVNVVKYVELSNKQGCHIRRVHGIERERQ